MVQKAKEQGKVLTDSEVEFYTYGEFDERNTFFGVIGISRYYSDKEVYKYAMHNILRSLIENYTSKEVEQGKPILYHGVYSWHSGKGVDEGNIWGDYFYLEALMRFYKDWELYW